VGVNIDVKAYMGESNRSEIFRIKSCEKVYSTR
jgi:hypothetical protein